MARLCPLFSGSSGNSYYIGSEERGVLIDAGRSAKQITEKLAHCGIPLSAIEGIFVTHEHSDHVQGLRVFAGRHHIPVYASFGTLEALNDAQILNGKFPCAVIGPEGLQCGGMEIVPFHTSHDCAEGYGYLVKTADDHRVAFSTDLGVITPEVEKMVEGADFVVLESNHDVGMLRNGPYPYPLKRRILSSIGHLSNETCAEYLPYLARKGASRFLLAHLSNENNTPELAYQTALCSLKMAGLEENRDFILSVAPRENIEGSTILF